MEGGCREMKRGIFNVLMIFLVVGVCIMGEKGMERMCHSEPPRGYLIPAERTYVGTLIFESSRSILVDADCMGDYQEKRVGGRYILTLTDTYLNIEIYAWGTRELYRVERYSLAQLREDYPAGASVWIEQDETSTTTIFIPLE